MARWNRRVTLALPALWLAACSSPNSTDVDPDAAGQSTGLFGYIGPRSGEAGEGTGGSALIDGAGATGSGASGSVGPAGDACAVVEQEAENSRRPVDIIFIIDNSGSMAGEISQVQARINDDFVRIIEESSVDYRVIMLSRYGDVDTRDPIGDSDHPICIHQPLGAGECVDPENELLDHNPPIFFHFSADITSHASLCIIFEAFSQSDEIGEGRPDWIPIARNGYSAFLRERALKTFVEITDDGVNCSTNATADGSRLRLDDGDNAEDGEAVAEAFDAALLELSPEHFGTAAQRNYNFYSIVAMDENDPETAPWQPEDPIQEGMCSAGGGAEAPGTGYQALSIMTDALRYPTCLNDNFDAIFQAIAQGVVSGSLSCEWAIPAPPSGQTLDREKVSVLYTPGESDEAEPIPYVDVVDNCDDGGGWYYNDKENPTRVVVCNATCDRLRRDPDGAVMVRFECERVIEVQ